MPRRGIPPICGCMFVVQIVLDAMRSAAQRSEMMSLLIILSRRCTGSSDPVRSMLSFVCPPMVILRRSASCSGICTDLRRSIMPSCRAFESPSRHVMPCTIPRERLRAKISRKLTSGAQRRMTISTVMTPRANMASPLGQPM